MTRYARQIEKICSFRSKTYASRDPPVVTPYSNWTYYSNEAAGV